MRNHPIPPVTEPLQYRAIGLVRGTYTPKEPEQLTRGALLDSNGVELETVVLGRVLTLMRRHLAMDQSHLWVVYPSLQGERSTAPADRRDLGAQHPRPGSE